MKEGKKPKATKKIKEEQAEEGEEVASLAITEEGIQRRKFRK